MKSPLLLIILILLFGCGTSVHKSEKEWKTIEIGDYLFDCPNDFELVNEKGTDSYVGKIKGDSMWLGFDYGFYADKLELTPQEYLEEGTWKVHLPSRFMKAGITYNQNNAPTVEVLNIRAATKQDSAVGKGCDYIAKCQHDKTVFDYAIYLPQEIKQSNFFIDTFENQFRKIVIAKNPQSGTTGLYLRDLNGFNKSFNSYLALSMSTSHLTLHQQALALKIFKTGRSKKRG